MQTPTATIPGPRGHFLLGSLPDIQRDRVQFLVDLQRDYGDIVKIRLGPAEAIAVFHPDAVRRVLQENQGNYSKDTLAFKKLRLIAGNGLITSNGDFWLRQRRLMQPAFHRERINTLCDVIVQQTERILDPLETAARDGQTVNMVYEMMNLTMGVATQAMFGSQVQDVDGQLSEAIAHLMRDTTFRFEHPFYPPPRFPTGRNRQFSAALAHIDRLIYAIIDERRKHPGQHNDLLEMMMDAQVEESELNGGEPSQMTDKQLRDECVTLLLAGFETTASSLCWTLTLLTRHPEVEARLRAEISEVLGDRAPGLEDIPRLKYTQMVRDESMRLFPPAWLTERMPVKADVLCGYRIPAGITLAITQFVTHRHPEFWPDPEKFDPQRFSAENSRGRHEYAFFPFGGGGRQCLGKNLALLETTLVLAMLVQRFKFELEPGWQVARDAQLALRLKGGLRMRLAAV